MKLTIDRSRWLRANAFIEPNRYTGKVESATPKLLDEKGRMCCLGFYVRSCGASAADVRDSSVPTSLGKRLPAEAKWLTKPADSGESVPLVEDVFTKVNDDATLSARERESRLKEMFAARGVEVRFVGRSPRKPRTADTPGEGQKP